MSPSSGKASGKIACDWPHDAELQNAYKRIAELEAEVERLITAIRRHMVSANEQEAPELEGVLERGGRETEPFRGKASGKTPRPPKDVMTALFFGEAVFSPSAQNALANYIAELEAIIASKQQLLEKLTGPDCGPDPVLEESEWLKMKARAEKAEAEVERLKDMLAEETRNNPTRLFPERVNPSGEPLGGGGRESGGEGVGDPASQVAAAAEPAAPSLSARKATRKTGHYHVEFDPNCSACRFAADPAARKERDEG